MSVYFLKEIEGYNYTVRENRKKMNGYSIHS
jgi:hypothetical protein